MLIKMAFRNIRRHWIRTLFGIMSIMLGVSLLILFSGLLDGSNIGMIESMVKTNYGDLRLYTKDYYNEKEKFPLDNLFSNAGALRKDLENVSGVDAVTPRLEFTSFLSDGVSQIPLIGVGIDPVLDNKVFNLEKYIIRGHYLHPEELGIIISESISEAFGVDVGSYLTVMARTKYESISADDYLVVGIFNTYNPDVDEVNFFMDLEEAQYFLELEDEVSVPIVKLIQRRDAPQIAAFLENNNTNIQTRTWLEMTRAIREIIKVKSAVSSLFGLLLLVMAAFGIMNTMLMAYFERLKEMGTMSALGMTHKQIYRLFMLEGVIIGLAGMSLGLAIGGGFNYYLFRVGFPLEKMVEVKFALREGRMYADFNTAKMLVYGLVGFLTAIFSAWFPARKIKALSPAEVLRK